MDKRDTNFSVQDILEHEPEILRSEVEESLDFNKDRKGTRNRQNKHRDNKSSRRSRCRTAVDSMQSSLERWSSTDGVGQSIIIPVWKRKGDRIESSQYMDISLLSQPSKVFARILEKMII